MPVIIISLTDIIKSINDICNKVQSFPLSLSLYLVIYNTVFFFAVRIVYFNVCLELLTYFSDYSVAFL
jgi:hypothetical protein